MTRLLRRVLAALIDHTTTTAAAPRRPLAWSVQDTPTGGTAWQCLVCESGHGSHPLREAANRAAHAHWTANHVPVGAL